MRVRHLPVVQNWDCQSCGNCCREYDVPVTEDERRRIVAQGWSQDPAIGKLRLFGRRRFWSSRYRLNHRREGGCVFLSDKNRCLIHERFGSQAKPLACRLFPFVLVPSGDHWRVSLRFACPSAAENRGRSVTEHEADLHQLARLLEKQESLTAQSLPPAFLQRGQPIDWPDLQRFAHSLLKLLGNRQERMERRLRKCVRLAQLCRQARFDQIGGGRLSEFLQVVGASLDADVPEQPCEVIAPTWVGRLLFRQVLAIYARKDRGANRGAACKNPLALLRAAWRFARGRGAVPKLNAFIPDTTFERVEAASGVLPAAAEETLERYYLTKIGSLQFVGPTNYGLPMWDGLEALLLTCPAILWLARALEQYPREEALTWAVHLVDDHFGYNRVFATGRLRFVQRTLSRRGELERLIAWYSRPA